MNSKERIYSFYLTEDGSPTLSFSYKEGSRGEKMHHSAGALGESIYIYGSAIDLLLNVNKSKNLNILSLGLGLGYNELLIASKSLGKENVQVTSFEIEYLLVKYFMEWLEVKPEFISAQNFNRVNNSNMFPPRNEFFKNYDIILKQISGTMKVEPKELKKYLRSNYEMQKWLIFSDFKAETFLKNQNLIFFDLYSKNTDPDLWEEDFLCNWLNNVSSPDCIFTTYACSGSLKKALHKAAFSIEIKKGYSGKRESILAIKNGP